MATKEDKTPTPAEELTKDAQKDTRFYFPEHSLTITAATREEAEKELAEIIKQEKEDAE